MRPPRALGGALIAAALCGCAPTRATITVQPAESLQVIDGWEATAQAGQGFAIYERYRDTLLARAVDDLGLTRLRVEVRSGSEQDQDYGTEEQPGAVTGRSWRCARYWTVNDNDDPRVIRWEGFHFTELDQTIEKLFLPMKRLVEARGEHLALNINYVAFVGQCGQDAPYVHASVDEYAEFVLATVMHLQQRYGLVPDYWEPVLEPATRRWPGRHLGEAIVAAAARLREEGFGQVKFIAPSTVGMATALEYYDAMSTVPGARELVAELSYHRYRRVSSGALRAIGEHANARVHTAMLEKIGAGYDQLHDDLDIGRVSAWQQYGIYYPDGRSGDHPGQYLVVDSAGGRWTVRLSKWSRFLRQYFVHVRPGAQRIGAASTSGRVRPLAFINTDGRYAVIAKTSGAAELEVAGLPPRQYAVEYTTGSADGAPTRVAVGDDGILRASIPARGVLSATAVP